MAHSKRARRHKFIFIAGSVQLIAGLASLAAALPVGAAELHLSSTTLEVTAPGAATSLTMRNVGLEPLNVQLRVFRWAQADGRDQLSPTQDVVASPPFARLQKGQNFTIRVVRTSRKPVAPEESYRLLIDEIPNPRAGRGANVKFAVRYSLPVFFNRADARNGRLVWQARAHNGRLLLKATNMGQRRVRISDLRIKTRTGQMLARRNGLFGYVLGNASMSWVLSVSRRIAEGQRYDLIAQSDAGNIHVPILLVGRH